MLNITKVHHINICIPENGIQIAREFYIDLLGFTEIEKPDMFRDRLGFWLLVDGQEIHISTEKDHKSSEWHPAYLVDNLEQVLSYLEQNKIKIKYSEPMPNYDRFSFYDPFGNRIELMKKR